MAGIALLLDLLKKNPSLATHSLHSHSVFSATVAASAAAAAVAAARPFASREIYGFNNDLKKVLSTANMTDGFSNVIDGNEFGLPIAYCDAASETLNIRSSPFSQSTFENELAGSVNHQKKEYPLEMKSLFSAFGLKSLAATSLRSFLLFYLPLLEPSPPVDENDDFLTETSEEKPPVDYVTPFFKSLKQIIREVSVVTTRRVLERIMVHHVSPRMAWKLLKDLPKSAKHKAGRGMPTMLFFYSVSRSTFRGHLLGVAPSSIIQVIIEIYRCFIRKHINDDEDIDTNERFRLFMKKVYSTIIKGSASLVFASAGAGIGALVHPSNGQWIGTSRRPPPSY